MTHVVAYDIEDNRTRAKLARYLESKGVRLQKSVFAVELERHQIKRFLNDIRKIVGENDDVAVFRLCEGCRKSAIQRSPAREFVYIF